MIDRVEASSILRESTVTVFVNSVAGGGRARSCLPQIQKLFEAFRIHAQIVMTNSAAELESCAKNAISQGRRALFAMGDRKSTRLNSSHLGISYAVFCLKKKKKKK